MMATDLLAFIATFASSLFAGAALYINVAEHPARLECGHELAATVFGPSYRRAAGLQASLALLATITGSAVALLGRSPLWWVGVVSIFAVVPFTFLVIMRVNRQLLDPILDRAAPDTRRLLVSWGRLHAVRTVLGLLAAMIFLALALRQN